MNSSYDFSFARVLRNRLGLTLKELAGKTGLTYTTLENIEINKTLPSLKTLDALAGGLGISTSELLSLSENQMVQRRKAELIERKDYTSDNEGIEKCKVAFYDNAKVIRIFADPAEKVHVMSLHENCNEICYVLSGCVELEVGGDKHQLSADESILFDGMMDHSYTQIEAGEYITIHIPKDAYVLQKLLRSKSTDLGA